MDSLPRCPTVMLGHGDGCIEKAWIGIYWYGHGHGQEKKGDGIDQKASVFLLLGVFFLGVFFFLLSVCTFRLGMDYGY